MISQANVPLMRKHTADILRGTDQSLHYLSKHAFCFLRENFLGVWQASFTPYVNVDIKLSFYDM